MAIRIYTKTGDSGETALFGGKRVGKDDIRVQAYGELDALNVSVGLVRDCMSDSDGKALLQTIQEQLFTIGSHIATEPGKSPGIPLITAEDIGLLEASIDDIELGLEPLRHFILPGGHIFVSFCHLARCTCRSAERAVVALSRESAVDPLILSYLNRLSDFLFVLARKLSKDTGSSELTWIPGRG